MRAVSQVSDDRLAPLTVVGGDAGSGKSTLLRHLLTSGSRGSLAVVVNDVAALGLDSTSVARREGALLTLTNGNQCCATGGDAASALAALRPHITADTHVLLEAEASARLERVAGYAYMRGYRANGIVVVVDAEAVRRRVELAENSRVVDQIGHAEIIVVNKTDLVAQRARKQLQDWLHTLVPRAHGVETSYGRIASPLLFGIPPEEAERDARAVPSTWETTFKATGRRARAESADTETDDVALSHRMWTLATTTPVAANTFRRWSADLPGSITRGNGFVHLNEDPHYRYVFELVGRRHNLHRERPWGTATPETRLALVGM